MPVETWTQDVACPEKARARYQPVISLSSVTSCLRPRPDSWQSWTCLHWPSPQVSHAGNLDRFLGRKNMLTHMLAHPYAIGGFSYAGIWAFYGLTQGLRESKSPQNHLFSWNVPYAAFFATEYFSASFIICRIRRWRCWRRGCWGRAWTVSFQCCLLPSTLSSLLAESSGLGW